MVPHERSCHKQYKYAIRNPHLFWSESYGKGSKFCSRTDVNADADIAAEAGVR